MLELQQFKLEETWYENLQKDWNVYIRFNEANDSFSEVLSIELIDTNFLQRLLTIYCDSYKRSGYKACQLIKNTFHVR